MYNYGVVSSLLVGDDNPSLRDLYDHVVPSVTSKWKDLGVQLLDSHEVLKFIAANFSNDVERCCKEMLEKWLDL